MSRQVCLVCDGTKRVGARRLDASSLTWCEHCHWHTASRSVARDLDRIAPDSHLTFREQRELYQAERGRSAS